MSTAAVPRHDDELRERIADRILVEDPPVTAGDRSAMRRAVARALAAEGVVVSPSRWATLVRDLVDEFAGLGPLESVLRSPDVTDVMVNGPDDVWVDRGGTLEPSGVRFRDAEHLVEVTRRALAPLGVRLDRAHPWADAVLHDGVRIHAVLPPLAERPLLTLRRVPPVIPSWSELESTRTVPADLAVQLREAIADRRNIVLCGRAGVGKTTLLARLLAEVGSERVVIIEDAPELNHPSTHSVHLHVRPPTPDGTGGVEVAELVRNALRMRPDRLVIGEVRGREVADMLQAMNTGHDGSMTTVHANGAGDALVRLEGMALLASVPLEAVRAQLASALDLVVALDRDRAGRRHVREVVEVTASGPQGVWP